MGQKDLELRFRYSGDTLTLSAVVATDGGDHVRIPLGTITEGTTGASAPLPDSAVGGTLIALGFTHGRFIYGPHQHEMRRGTVTFEGLDGLVDARPIDFEVFTVDIEVIRFPQPTDGLVLPAVVSPELAGSVDPDGILRLAVGGGRTLPLRVVGTARRFPTVVEASPRFVVVSLEPYLVALNAAAPGAGRPTEMWLRTGSPARTAEVRAALAGDPFRFPAITDRAALVAEQAGDPLSQSIAWALLVAGLAGLILSASGVLLGAAADLRDERGELADLEAQGLPPSVLRVLVVGRTAWLAAGGALAGLVVGVVLTATVTAALALTADGSLPIPALRIVVPIGPVLAIVAGVSLAVLAVVAGLAQRTYAVPRVGGTGGRADPAALTTVLPPGTRRPMADAVEAVALIRIHPSNGGAVAALRGLDLRVETGEIAAILGPSGSGKSTLLRLIAGLDRPTAGRLTALGRELGLATDRELARYRRDGVGMVEQHYRRALSPYLRAADAIALPLALRGASPAAQRRRADELLERVGLAGRGAAFRTELSGGEQQRLAFAVAMAARPALLLADEPTGELDAATAATVLEMARDLVRAEGATRRDRDSRSARRAGRGSRRPCCRRAGRSRTDRPGRGRPCGPSMPRAGSPRFSRHHARRSPRSSVRRRRQTRPSSSSMRRVAMAETGRGRSAFPRSA